MEGCKIPVEIFLGGDYKVSFCDVIYIIFLFTDEKPDTVTQQGW